MTLTVRMGFLSTSLSSPNSIILSVNELYRAKISAAPSVSQLLNFMQLEVRNSTHLQMCHHGGCKMVPNRSIERREWKSTNENQ